MFYDDSHRCATLLKTGCGDGVLGKKKNLWYFKATTPKIVIFIILNVIFH